MAQPLEPPKVKLFIGVLYSRPELLAQVKEELIRNWGEIDYQSPVFPFDCTTFYEPEMGENIQRIFYSFARLVEAQELVVIKHQTNAIEDRWRIESNRKINLDPGYLDYFKVVLASFKFCGQKIYLDKGVYADITLWYEKGDYKPFIWGFPDFKSGRYNQVLLQIRRLYKQAFSGGKLPPS